MSKERSDETRCDPECNVQRRLARDSSWGICPKCKTIYRAVEIVTFHDSNWTASDLLEYLENDLAALKAHNENRIRPIVEKEVDTLKRYGVTRKSKA